MASSGIEPFPALSGAVPRTQSSTQNGTKTTSRRKSGGLGGELPGDSDVAALGTLSSHSPSASSADLSRSPSEKPARRSKRRTVRKALSRFKRQAIRHTWLVPLILTLTIISLYLIYPYPSNPVSAALFLSYPLPREASAAPDSPILYDKGARDFAFVGFYIIVLSFTREFIMQRIIKPIALSYGIKGQSKQARFLEQFYTAVYFSIFGPYGLWVMSRTPIWYFNTTAMYEGFPHKTHEAVFKAYYLLQAAYWAQQGIVLALMLEKPRKDFRELVAHHFITLSLIWLSYRFNFTYMGIAVYICHDVSDFFLATSKVLNYIDHPIVGPYFVVFMSAWGYTRHYLCLKILYSITTEFATVGPFEINWETQQYKCRLSQVIAFSLLAALQAVNLYWWFLICRIAYRFVVTSEVDDERSEYEDSEAEEEGEKMKANLREFERQKKERKRKENEKKANGVTNGAPKLLINGEDPSAPEFFSKDEAPNSIDSSLRERKKVLK